MLLVLFIRHFSNYCDSLHTLVQGNRQNDNDLLGGLVTNRWIYCYLDFFSIYRTLSLNFLFRNLVEIFIRYDIQELISSYSYIHVVLIWNIKYIIMFLLYFMVIYKNCLSMNNKYSLHSSLTLRNEYIIVTKMYSWVVIVYIRVFITFIVARAVDSL